MKTRLFATSLCTFAVGLFLAGATSAAMVGIYRNVMETTAQRSQA